MAMKFTLHSDPPHQFGKMILAVFCRYCMPWPRHLLQSVEVAAVTQSRVSDDYTPGSSQWQIGDTTILSHALGLASFKDVKNYFMSFLVFPY